MSGGIKKGDVLSVAQVAGIMAAKRTFETIPMCHPLLLTGADVEFTQAGDGIEIRMTVKTRGKTGVEMEALNGVSAAALTIYDMCKAIDRGWSSKKSVFWKKDGGRSGHFIREESFCKQEKIVYNRERFIINLYHRKEEFRWHYYLLFCRHIMKK